MVPASFPVRTFDGTGAHEPRAMSPAEVTAGTFTIPEAPPRKSRTRTGIRYVPSVTRSFVTRSLKKFLRLQLVESAFCVVALPGNACTLFVSALWRHHLLVLTEERKEKKIA
jgi:hypothetical protein